MNLRRSFRKSLLLSCGAALSLFLGACGSGGGSSPEHASPGTPAADTTNLAYKDLADTATTSLTLTTSGERDADTNTVRIFALVKDQGGTPLFFLNKYNFNVQLNPQAAPSAVDHDSIAFATATSTDRVVALVIDSSGSMATVDPTTSLTRLQAAQAAAKLYLESMAEGDYAAIVTFNTDAQTVQALTDDKDLLTQAIDSLTATGATNFGAAVTKAVEAVGSRPGKRAMILLTDGDDTVDTVTGGPDVWLNNSKSTRYEGLVAAQANDFRIYTVSLGADISDTGRADLRAFADQTGGAYFPAATTSALTTPFAQTIPDEIAALPPMETFLLSFPNPYPAKAGQTFDVPYGVTVSYKDGNGTLTDYIDGSYPVP